MDHDAEEFLRHRPIGVLATSSEGQPQACTIFFVVADDGSVCFKSRSGSDHMRALREDDRAALAVYDHDSTYSMKSGVQVKGTVERISDENVMERVVRQYSSCFEGAQEKFDPVERLVRLDAESTMFRLVPTSYKFIDGPSARLDADYRP